MQPIFVQMEPTDPSVGAGFGRGYLQGQLLLRSPFLLLQDAAGRNVSSLTIRSSTHVLVGGKEERAFLRVSGHPPQYSRQIIMPGLQQAQAWADGELAQEITGVL